MAARTAVTLLTFASTLMWNCTDVLQHAVKAYWLYGLTILLSVASFEILSLCLVGKEMSFLCIKNV